MLRNCWLRWHRKGELIGRKRVSRKLGKPVEAGRVIDFPPGWTFTIECPHHGPIDFDFTPFRTNGRDQLAAELRDAVWSMRHEVVGNTLDSFVSVGIARFWVFLDSDPGAAHVKCLADIDEQVIRQFLAWMELQIATKGKNKGRAWTQSFKKLIFDRMKSLLVNRQKRTPLAVSPALLFPKNPFPQTNSRSEPREPYTDSEFGRIVAAVNQDLKLLDLESMEVLPALQVLTVHVVALALATGRNAQSLLDLRCDSLRAHPLRDREILVTNKRRGYSTHATTYRADGGDNVATSTVPTTVGGYVRALSDFTAPLIADAREADRGFILLYRMERMTRKGQVIRLNVRKFNQAAKVFCSRHALRDDRGRPLQLYLSRLRPTFGTKLYERTRDVRKVQMALGHSDPKITARRYITLPADAERNHVFVGQAMVGWATSTDDKEAVRLAADKQMPLADARKLLQGGYNTLIARCRNPFRSDDGVCAKYLPCFTCPQMVVFEDDLWRLYSFYYKLIFERVKMNPNDWVNTYGPVIKVIDDEVAPQFDAHAVMAAKQRAQDQPHPAWPRTLRDE